MRNFVACAAVVLLPAGAVFAAMEHVVVAREAGAFVAWPANGGLWAWDEGREALVAFIGGSFKEQPGHNIGEEHTNLVARSCDGGLTWKVERPAGFAQPGAEFAERKAPVDFTRTDFALRCTATGYHGATDPRGGFLFSCDRGRTWEGPFRFRGLDGCEPLKGWEVTCRTDYLVNGPSDALLMLSARRSGKGGTDRTFVGRTTDGGRHFEFGGWVVGPDDPNRAVMPSTVRMSATRLVTAIRRRAPDQAACWVDVYGSENDGATWTFLSRAGDTGGGNGNPPALLRLRDGRLCCAYGNRDRRQMLARLSPDGGRTWGDPLVLRDGYRPDRHGDADLGYPRLFQRPDGRVVTIYYWSQADAPESCIAATLWPPPAP